jgi:hypothetical protein
MQHKKFELHAIKTYTHKTLVELYIYNVNRQIHSVNAHIHIEMTVSIYMQHRHEMTINITCK